MSTGHNPRPIDEEPILRHFYRKGRKQFVPLTISELVRATKASQRAVVGFLNDMAIDGCVEKHTHKVDKICIYHLTPRGQSMARRELEL